MNWKECLGIMQNFDSIYAMEEDQQKYLFNLLRKLPKNPTILEIGVAHGRSAAMFCYIAKALGGEYWGIDDWSLGSSELEVVTNLSAYGFTPHILTQDSRNSSWDRALDFLLIDGGHYEDPVRNDCAKFIPHIKPGGIVGFHDWVDDETVNAHMSIRQYGKQATDGWKQIAFVRGLMIRQRP